MPGARLASSICATLGCSPRLHECFTCHGCNAIVESGSAVAWHFLLYCCASWCLRECWVFWRSIGQYWSLSTLLASRGPTRSASPAWSRCNRHRRATIGLPPTRRDRRLAAATAALLCSRCAAAPPTTSRCAGPPHTGTQPTFASPDTRAHPAQHDRALKSPAQLRLAVRAGDARSPAHSRTHTAHAWATSQVWAPAGVAPHRHSLPR